MTETLSEETRVRSRTVWKLFPLVIAGACAIPATGPIALDDFATTEAGRAVEIHVLANDRAPTGAELLLVEVSGGSGTAEITADGTIRYSPSAGFDGIDRFTYRAASSSGETVSATVAVTVNRPTVTTITQERLLIVSPADINFMEVFATIGKSVPVLLEARGGDFDIGLITDGDVTIGADPGCDFIAAGQRCAATVRWLPRRPTTLDRQIELGGTTITVQGTAVSPLAVSPTQIEDRVTTPALDHRLRLRLRNVADQPITVGPIAGRGGLENAHVVTSLLPQVTGLLSQQPCPSNLPPEAECAVDVSLDWVNAVVGDYIEGSVDITYGDTSLMIPVGLIAVPMPPAWLFPSPGQGVWWGLLGEGLEVQWEPVHPDATYLVEAEICLKECELWPLRMLPDTRALLLAPSDPNEFEQQMLAASDEGLTPLLSLQVTASVATNRVVATSDPSKEAYQLLPEPFEIISVDYDPPPGTQIYCDETLSIIVDYRSYLVAEALLTASPEEDGQPVDVDAQGHSVVPGPSPQPVIVSFAVPHSLFDRIRLTVTQLIGNLAKTRFTQSFPNVHDLECVE